MRRLFSLLLILFIGVPPSYAQFPMERGGGGPGMAPADMDRPDAPPPVMPGRGGPAITPAARTAIRDIETARGAPLTVAERNTVANAVGAAQTAMPNGRLTAAQARTVGETVLRVSGEREAAGAPLTRPQMNQVVNACVWGFQFVKDSGGNTGRGFTVTHNGTEARVSLNEGSRTGNGMRIVLPGQSTGNLNLAARADGSVQFAMQTTTIGRGSGNYTQATIMSPGQLEANGNRGALQGTANLAGFSANAAGFAPGGNINAGAGAGQIALTRNIADVPADSEVRITAAVANGPAGNRPGGGRVAMNVEFVTPTSPGGTTPGGTTPPGGDTYVSPGITRVDTALRPEIPITPVPTGGAPAPVAPAGHDAAAPTHSAGANPATAIQLPATPVDAGGVRNAPQIPQGPTIDADPPGAGAPPVNVNAIANHNPDPVNAGHVAVVPQPGNQNLVVVQTPAAFNNRQAIAGAAPVVVPLTLTGRDGSTIQVMATANRETNGNGSAGREMGARNGTLSFTVPNGFQVARITAPTMPSPQRFQIDINDANQSRYSPTVR